MTVPFYARYIPSESTVVHQRQASQLSASQEKRRIKKRKKDVNEPLGDESAPKKHQKLLSKFQKSSLAARGEGDGNSSARAVQDTRKPSPVLHDLTALPQPPSVDEKPYQPEFASVPSWLTKPYSVSSTTSAPFSSFNIGARTVQNLQLKGYTDALAIQAAVIPLLLLNSVATRGDICIAASTGSGKTLAYIVPIIEHLRARVSTGLRALVVVPTRDLAAQVRDVAELCASGSHVRIGMATGSRALGEEQQMLVKKGQRYSPRVYAEHQRRADQKLQDGFVGHDSLLAEDMMTLPGHVRIFESNVDLLICTPGRLVVHLKETDGFDLDKLEWLVLDEADRLVDESFQEWLDTLMDTLERRKPISELTARERIIRMTTHEVTTRQVCKVVLSATMTHDLEKLNSLRLRKPTLVALEDTGADDGNSPVSTVKGGQPGQGEGFLLPSTLKEWAVPVGDGSKKPLYLLILLKTRIFPSDFEKLANNKPKGMSERVYEEKSLSQTAININSAAALHHDQRYNELSVSPTSTLSLGERKDVHECTEGASHTPESKVSVSVLNDQRNKHAGTLIFTKSNESATRLSHLLSLMHPPYANSIGTVTKTSTASEKRKVLSAFSSGTLSIVVASDRVSRGLDIPNLAHIISYDMPRSLTTYIHRVGRTARAGKEGQAWTLFTDVEARWFWHAIARAPEVKRGDRTVERLRIDESEVGDATSQTYTDALKELQDAVVNVKL